MALYCMGCRRLRAKGETWIHTCSAPCADAAAGWLGVDPPWLRAFRFGAGLVAIVTAIGLVVGLS